MPSREAVMDGHPCDAGPVGRPQLALLLYALLLAALLIAAAMLFGSMTEAIPVSG